MQKQDELFESTEQKNTVENSVLTLSALINELEKRSICVSKKTIQKLIENKKFLADKPYSFKSGKYRVYTSNFVLYLSNHLGLSPKSPKTWENGEIKKLPSASQLKALQGLYGREPLANRLDNLMGWAGNTTPALKQIAEPKQKKVSEISAQRGFINSLVQEIAALTGVNSGSAWNNIYREYFSLDEYQQFYYESKNRKTGIIDLIEEAGDFKELEAWLMRKIREMKGE